MAAIRHPPSHPLRSYADTLSTGLNEHSPNTTKPIFIKEIDLFGAEKPPKEFWLTHVEVYKALALKIEPECIAGIQRVNKFWRIYLDNDDSRDEILSNGIVLRDRTMPIYNTNPGRPYLQDNSVRIRIKNIPLSADDGQIHRALILRKCEITALYREKLRVDGKLTNCETGDRIAIVKEITTHIPKTIEIGRYRAVVYYKGQPNDNVKCTKCLDKGHSAKECTNDIVCHHCYRSGHKATDCQEPLSEESDAEDIVDDASETPSEETFDEINQPQNQPQSDSAQAQQDQTKTGTIPEGTDSRVKKTTGRKKANKT
ncbi:hypothetical protein FSP39_021070 [Pinctada imbricata]|uniref:CCHC-type domain-containing protein n=1 Tax=Pinctada imbricata TaxID=66713 RepID=A0AA88Y8D0_PINIB|nr:hypothetical protein FSP39_021070 [Pinctada imbricata]